VIIKETKIAKNGFCRHCGGVLERQPSITDEEFVELRQAFMDKSLIRNGNIFLQSSPDELSAFRQFLEKHQSRPFTVAFDGLNIANCTGEPNSQLVGELDFVVFVAALQRQYQCSVICGILGHLTPSDKSFVSALCNKL